jgi:AraC family ethanolamine operon transcriptional activator
MKKAVLGELAFHTNQHESSLLIEGVNPADLVAIGFQSPHSMPRHMLGERFTNADVFLAGPRAEHFATVLPGQHTFQILIPAKKLEEEFASRLHLDPIDFASQRYFIKLGKHRVRELIGIVALSFRAANDLIGSAPSPLALTQIEKTLVEQVVSVLTAAEPDLFRQRPSFSSAGWALLQTREFFQEHEGSPVRLADVCRALGVSQRTLQVAFAEGLGVSPMQYLKLHRLHLVRTRLKETSAQDVAVSKAAREAGFVDLSRFSRDYKKLFGQLPSKTPRG